jgi:hypothetical protein
VGSAHRKRLSRGTPLTAGPDEGTIGKEAAYLARSEELEKACTNHRSK